MNGCNSKSQGSTSNCSTRFSGGSVLCCSSLNSADIKHYNANIRKRRESE
ncbi:hypothetical protein A2U01_0071020, partial [Trifolium medium]|nr:hypothetical protein [Trifolium medium]